MTTTDEYMPAGLADVASLAPGDLLLAGGRWCELLHGRRQGDGTVILYTADDTSGDTRNFLSYVGHQHRARRMKPPAPTVTRSDR